MASYRSFTSHLIRRIFHPCDLQHQEVYMIHDILGLINSYVKQIEGGLEAGSRQHQVRKVDFILLLAFGLFTWRNNFIIISEVRGLLCVKPSQICNFLHFIHTAFCVFCIIVSRGVLISPQPYRETNKIQRQKILIFIYPIYNHNWRNISTIYIQQDQHQTKYSHNQTKFMGSRSG